MKRRAICLGDGFWAVQWRVLYVFRGLEKDYEAPAVWLPHTVIRPNKLFSSQGEAERWIYALLTKEEEDRRARRRKGSWLPQAYY